MLPLVTNDHDRVLWHIAHSVLNHGTKKTDRTGTGTLSSFGLHAAFDCRSSLPLITTKKLYLKSLIAELVGFLNGVTNANDFNVLGTGIWDAWADKHTGDLGPIYGKQWRAWEGADGRTHDQFNKALELLKTDPDSRRILVSAWNVGELDKMALMPCHFAFQFYHADGWLDLQWSQRSVDTCLGLPFNVASYGLLLHIVADYVGMKPRNLIGSLGDTHIYLNHVEGVKEWLTRESTPEYATWRRFYSADRHPSSLSVNEIVASIHGYTSRPPIPLPIAV